MGTMNHKVILQLIQRVRYNNCIILLQPPTYLFTGVNIKINYINISPLNVLYGQVKKDQSKI